MKRNNKKSKTEYVIESEYGKERIEKTIEKIIELFEKGLDKR